MDNLLKKDLEDLDDYVSGLQNRVELLRAVHDSNTVVHLLSEAVHYCQAAHLLLVRILSRETTTPGSSRR